MGSLLERLLPLPILQLLFLLLLTSSTCTTVGAGGGMGAALDATSILDETALEQLARVPSCAPVCPDGSYAIPKQPVAAHRPQANGCGPQSNAHGELGSEGRYQIKEPFGLIGCCNAHDLCFSTCGMAFEECEERFEQCMEGVCSASTTVASSTACRAHATRFSALTREFGCSFHRSSVHGSEGREAPCECTPAEQVTTSMTAWLADFHQEYGNEGDSRPTPAQNPAETRQLLWNLTVHHAERYVRWVENLEQSEMVVLDHDHTDTATRTQKNDDDQAMPNVTRLQPGGQGAPPDLRQAYQNDGYPAKASRRTSFPKHWGPPPHRQTKDLRPLPGGYGRGSSTLATWIKQNLRKDERVQDGEN